MQEFSLLENLKQFYAESPVLGTIIALVALAGMIAVVRKALKIAAGLIAIAIIAIAASWALRGTDATQETIEDSIEGVSEHIKDSVEGDLQPLEQLNR